ncbi:MAG: ATP-dependent helicase [Lentilactobacillus diolivorans]
MVQSTLNLTREQAIDLLEKATGMQFSDEQLRILKQPFSQPTLINACAGAGKTTIFMLSTLVAIMTGDISARAILGITFSKKAQTDMQVRYQQYLDQLSEVGMDLSDAQAPYFSTFHALFYRLLRITPAFRETQVLASYKHFAPKLSTHIKHTHSQVSSPSEILDNMFELAEFIVNRGISDNAFADLIDPKELRNQLREAGKDEFDLGFYTDYLSVMNEYTNLKRQNRLVDFNDMKIQLNQLLNDDAYLPTFRQAMTRFKLVVMDEFQDIDNLQWKIMTKLLSDDALAHLVVIGDDDQSIYSFRGSNPDFILNFHHLLPAAKTYHLSTNYRTGGHILTQARPVIASNHVRLVKQLKAFSQDDGKVNVYQMTHAGFDPDSQMFRQLIQQIKDPKIDNHQIALLVRFNSDRTLVADWLANQNILVNINNRAAILQHTLIYRILIHLTQAFWEDDFEQFHSQATRIGFTTYRRHVSDIENASGDKLTSMTAYFSAAEVFNDQHQKTTNQKRFARLDQRIQRMVNRIQRSKHQWQKAPSIDALQKTIQQIWQNIQELTAVYFHYMTSNDFISKETLTDTTNYLITELKQLTDLDQWFDQETTKKQLLEDNLSTGDSDHIQFLSLHQAKGLEFKYVYLYGLTDKQLPTGTTIINRWFHPDISFEDFIDRWQSLASQSKKISELTSVLESAFIEQTEEIKRNPHIDLKQLQIEQYSDKEMNLLYNWYTSIRNYSQLIEEERRLIYVGMTRASKVLNISFDSNFSPLLWEIPVVRDALEKRDTKH